MDDFFDLAETLHRSGARSTVMKARRRSDGAEVVVKVRGKRPDGAHDRNWRATMSRVHGMGKHRHVLDILEILEGRSDFCVVMPRCTGGDLFDFLASATEVSEDRCKQIIREILLGLGHFHRNGLVHCDVKPENILLDSGAGALPDAARTVKLIDFDTSLEWPPAAPRSGKCVGSPGYIAPEALMGQFSPQSDLWSVGVILYDLMAGTMPWSPRALLSPGAAKHPNAALMYSVLKASPLDWEQEPWTEFSSARDLCQRLLAFDPSERLPTVEEALSHPWFLDAPPRDKHPPTQ